MLIKEKQCSICKSKFSIIIPAYKKEYLRECIESVLNQTYEYFELILVDDDSPYQLSEVINSYDDKRIKSYKNYPGFGAYNLVKNWNKCLSYCTGDYVICMGDDDKLLPQCLENYVRLISEFPDKEVYHIRTQIIDENSKVIDIQEERPQIESVHAYIWNDLKGCRRQYIGDFLFLRSCLENVGGFFFLPYAWGSDRLSVIKAAHNTGIAYSNEFGFQYREHRKSISEQCDKDNIEGKIRAMQNLEKEYRLLLNYPVKNEVDKIYMEQAELILEKAFSKNIALSLAAAIAGQPTKIIYWMMKSKKLNLDKATIKRAIFYALGIRFRG